MRLIIVPGLVIAGFGLLAGSANAASAVQKECSAKYRAAKASNTLNGMDYREFYKQCSAQARATPAAATAAPAAAAPGAAAAPATAPAPVAAGNAVFPSAISPQYKSLSAGIARRKTCDDQYKQNKANNANGGLRWIEKGGGYYSECNKRLKG